MFHLGDPYIPHPPSQLWRGARSPARGAGRPGCGVGFGVGCAPPLPLIPPGRDNAGTRTKQRAAGSDSESDSDESDDEDGGTRRPGSRAGNYKAHTSQTKCTRSFRRASGADIKDKTSFLQLYDKCTTELTKGHNFIICQLDPLTFLQFGELHKDGDWGHNYDRPVGPTGHGRMSTSRDPGRAAARWRSAGSRDAGWSG